LIKQILISTSPVILKTWHLSLHYASAPPADGDVALHPQLVHLCSCEQYLHLSLPMRVIMTDRAILRVYLVHLINADLVPGGCQPSDQANRLRD